MYTSIYIDTKRKKKFYSGKKWNFKRIHITYFKFKSLFFKKKEKNPYSDLNMQKLHYSYDRSYA